MDIASVKPLSGWLTWILFLWGSAIASVWAAMPAGQQLHAAEEGPRIALVIGNGDYAYAPLSNSVNDARRMAEVLKKLGFDVVLKENADLSTMVDAMRDFSGQAKNKGVHVFYYAGHGFQLREHNFLVPIGNKIETEDAVSANAAKFTEFIDRIRQPSEGINIAILDTCREYPFLKIRKQRGFVEPKLQKTKLPEGTLVAFSTSQGGKASDGDGLASNGLYTKYLLQHIVTPGLEIEQLFKQVRTEVIAESNKTQIPWENTSLTGNFCFRRGPRGECGDIKNGSIK